MNEEERAQFLKEFPEAPVWMLDRSLAEARKLMQLRREAFPVTKPKQ